MNALIAGITWVVLKSISTSFFKKALDTGNISKIMFKMMAHFFWAFFFLALINIFFFQKAIFLDTTILLLALSISIMRFFLTQLEIYIFKNAKLSSLMPYENIDKIIIVIVSFFLYQWIAEKSVSLITFFITLFTIFIVIWFSLEGKKLKMQKEILLFIIRRIGDGVLFLMTGIILLKYNSITYWFTNFSLEFMVYFIAALLMNDSFSSLLKQTKDFYISRLLGVFLGWSSFILSLIIIEKTDLITASLLWFLSVIFNTLSMKFILHDTPTKKQILLSFIVIFLIGIWYYFK